MEGRLLPTPYPADWADLLLVVRVNSSDSGVFDFFFTSGLVEYSPNQEFPRAYSAKASEIARLHGQIPVAPRPETITSVVCGA